jgi:hypothetical protein
MANDLNELNTILFETLRGIKDGNIDTKQANSVIGISNALVNNAKVQIQAMKLTGGKKAPEFVSLPETPVKYKSKHEAMTVYAKEIGQKSVADAIADSSKEDFNKGFMQWAEDEMAAWK